jgi:hypothetical protein
MFAALSAIALIGWLLALQLNKRINDGAAKRIAAKIKKMDEDLGLLGEEKTLSKLIDEQIK